LALEIFMEKLDPGKYYFNAEDYRTIKGKYGDMLDNMVKRGDLGAGVEIFRILKQRVEQRAALVQVSLDSIEEGDLPETIRTRGPKSEWVEEGEMKAIWKDRILGEVARETERGGERSISRSEIENNIRKRHAQFLSDISLEEKSADEILLGAVCESYDPHTEYLGAEGMTEFSISMELKLCGIGVVLSQDNGEVKVESIVPGGPASKDGRMRKGDRIIGIGGDDGVEDVSGLRIDKIVRKIRGEQGTSVTLDLLRDGEGTASVTLVRDEVQLNNQGVRGAVIGREGGSVGVITVPSFYHDGKGRSVSADMRAVIESMKEKGVSALVVDLRQDGGGSLEESIRAAGIFVPGQTVVQIRDGDGSVDIRRAPAGGGAWDGPTIVLVDRNSASASEIFAGALKDHGAGILVGDSRTFGKGTVQALMGLSPGGLMRFIAPEEGAGGHLKLTIQKFYRANGESTQGKGVASDIRISSISDIFDNGEESFPTHIPHSKIPSTSLSSGLVTSSVISELRKKSMTRTESNEMLARIEERRAEIERRRAGNIMVSGVKEEGGPTNSFLSTEATILTSLRGGEVEIGGGEIGQIYEGNPVPTLGGDKSDPILEEAVDIAADWQGIRGAREIAGNSNSREDTAGAD
jgi:carboxyl-terminal processing protease